MSADPAALAALAHVTKSEVRYFELVILRFAGKKREDCPRCYLCVGKHALYFVRRTLTCLYPSEKGGEIYYAYVEQVVEDTDTNNDLVIILRETPEDWQSEKLFIESEYRSRLVTYMSVAWRTDYLWRFGKARSMHLEHKKLRKQTPEVLQAAPYRGYVSRINRNYSFWMKKSYDDRSKGAIIFGDARRSAESFHDVRRGTELRVEVFDPVQLQALEETGRDHIRWTANEYKQSVTEQMQHVVFLVNALYLKRMNLANDIACWTAWELVLQTSDSMVASILLRRQYMPPLMDTAQDIFVSVMAKTHSNDEARANLKTELLEEARLVADTVTPVIRDCTEYQTMYRELITAKLDSLQFGPDAMKWICSTVGLRPRQEDEAKVFLKLVLKVLQDENALNAPDLVNALQAQDAAAWRMLDLESPLQAAYQMAGQQGMLSVEQVCDESTDEGKMAKNHYMMRIARYLAWCVDGGLLGTQFTLVDITSVDLLSAESLKTLSDILHFLLHIRPKDMTKPFAKTTLYEFVHMEDFNQYIFNDKVMQTLLELGWIAKVLPAKRRVEADDAKKNDEKSPMSAPYATALARLMISSASSPHLKAAVCREIIKDKSTHKHFKRLSAALIHLLQSTSIYLKTYATATFVNLTNGHDAAKDAFMSSGMVHVVVEHLKLKDDDLLQYTLSLLTNLSKTVHHRRALLDCEIVEVLMELLYHIYDFKLKAHILAELCSVVGQLCNEEEAWAQICAPGFHTLDYTLHIYRETTSSKVRSKALFMLKQLCAMSGGSVNKEFVHNNVLHLVAEDLHEMSTAPPDRLDLDFAANAVLLLLVLSSTERYCWKMHELGLEETLGKFMVTQMGQLDSTRERLRMLLERVQTAGDTYVPVVA